MSKKNQQAEAYLKTDEKSYLDVKSLAEKHGVSMEDLFLNEKYDDEIVDILHPQIPKLRRMFISKEIFKKGYAYKRKDFILYFQNIAKR